MIGGDFSNRSILNRSGLSASRPHVKTPSKVLVIGASGGIGRAFCQQVEAQFPQVQLIRMARSLDKLDKLSIATQDIAFDLTDEVSIEAAVAALPEKSQIDWVFIATGWLHGEMHQPEKTFRSLSGDHLSASYQINTFGPALLLKNLLGRLDAKHPTVFGVLTARVGSISDNRLGGWYSYRSSKAALNMLIKNFSIELTRMKRPVVIVGLQPGTTDTDLSAPFQRGLSDEDLQTPEYTASQLVKVLSVLQAEDSGLLFDFLGLQFDP